MCKNINPLVVFYIFLIYIITELQPKGLIMTIYLNRVISLNNKKTSMRLVKHEWNILENICLKEKMKRKKLLELIDSYKSDELGLTPSVRLFSLLYLNNLLKEGSFFTNDQILQKTLSEIKG